jgi:nicotinate-nucleotide adenylyltransferase
MLETIKAHARIGILGGSFDPPHLGHQLLALSFLALENIEELLIIPCASHAQKENVSSFAHRFAMCKLAFRHFKHIGVLDIEEHISAPNYTIKTLRTLKNYRPDLQLIWGLGSDLVSTFDSWHEAEKLQELADFVIFQRENYLVSNFTTLLKDARVHQGYVLPDTNSTALRNFLRDRKNLHPCPLVDQKVFSYIKNHKLYN